MALHPASCMHLAEGKKATEEGVLEPSLQLGMDPPLPVLEVVFEALMMKDLYAQQVFGTKAAQISSICMCAWRIGFNSVVSSDASPFRCSRPGGRSYPKRPPGWRTKGCGRLRRRAGERISPYLFRYRGFPSMTRIDSRRRPRRRRWRSTLLYPRIHLWFRGRKRRRSMPVYTITRSRA
eukprot:4947271-Pleurochrysis_carterae.AAC.1